MNPIQKDELYENISQFLKGKGIELTEGSYTKGIHAGCSLLADAINLSQTGIERAKAGLDKKLNQVRQVIHEKTAPKSGGKASQAPDGNTPPTAAETNRRAPKSKTGKSKVRSPRKGRK